MLKTGFNPEANGSLAMGAPGPTIPLGTLVILYAGWRAKKFLDSCFEAAELAARETANTVALEVDSWVEMIGAAGRWCIGMTLLCPFAHNVVLCVDEHRKRWQRR